MAQFIIVKKYIKEFVIVKCTYKFYTGSTVGTGTILVLPIRISQNKGPERKKEKNCDAAVEIKKFGSATHKTSSWMILDHK